MTTNAVSQPKGPENVTNDEEWLQRRTDPAKTALLLIDFQNDFCADGGWYDKIGYPVGAAQAAARRTSSLLSEVRETGMLIVFVRCVYDRQYLPRVMIESYEHKGLPLDYCLEGTWGGDFYEVVPEPGDLVLSKHRYSAFIHTDLQVILGAREIENLVFAGVATNVCVDSTVRDGYMLDYRVTVLEDCCGTYDQGLHEATLETVRRAFGVVARSDDFLRALGVHTAHA
ncbi:MAG: cysteine hydrolase [Actinobacteria bacterium]|nr:cysteine hydrolase [Actinomycetota bacterium]